MEDNKINKFAFSEISFSVNDNKQTFYKNSIEKIIDDSSIDNNKYQKPFKIENILNEIKDIKKVTANYLQNVMESNDKLGALLSKIKDEEDKE